MKSMSVFFLCILAAALTLGAAPRPMTFESPLPPWCEDNGGQQPCLPWRPTPAPIIQSEQDKSPTQPGALPAAIQPGTLPPMTLPPTGGEPSVVFISIGFLFVGLGVLLVGIRGRSVVRVNLAALLEQVGPNVLGGDERVRLISIIRSIPPEQVVAIDLSKCAEK